MHHFRLWNASLLLILTIACTHDPYPAMNTDPGTDNPNPIGDTCDPSVVYFEQDVLPLLQANCAQSSCHDQGSAQDGVVLSDYASIMSTADVRPGNPNGSDLYEVLVETDLSKRMPPPPANPLTNEQISLIFDWIDQGAQNNSCEASCDTVDVRFSTHVQPLITNFCQSCHNSSLSSGGVQLETHSQIRDVAVNGRLISVLRGIAPYPNMRPSGALDECQIRGVEIWVEDGAPNN
mgnify:CR=1 FL=1